MPITVNVLDLVIDLSLELLVILVIAWLIYEILSMPRHMTLEEIEAQIDLELKKDSTDIT
ncbi:hypothetical protein [Acidianus brierleyi]|jgi:hypothetical protein|uniref:Uncharacterized protein n=1 Tax=Acidianus brierleyi TaxID=41673 RepID=A0A2U9IDK7_9CREN|nr:hypothetical protein [Acidianus brierleyi]AWR94079.1 hypothetical protein DFR85_05170 [Acidianus brierleyi]